MKTGAQIVLGIVAGVTIMETANCIQKIMKEQAELKRDLKKSDKESMYKDLQARFEREKRWMDKIADEKEKDAVRNGFERADKIVNEVFGHPAIVWKKMESFYDRRLADAMFKPFTYFGSVREGEGIGSEKG